MTDDIWDDEDENDDKCDVQMYVGPIVISDMTVWDRCLTDKKIQAIVKVMSKHYNIKISWRTRLKWWVKSWFRR